MKPRLHLSTDGKVYILLCALLCLYLFLRAVYVPLVHDEAATFFHFIHSGNFLPYQAITDANNHLLNSFLSWVSYISFGYEEWALRLPNVLSALLFFWFTWKISTFFSHRIVKWLFLFSFVGAHYMIEFFAYTRGYGMSIAFLTGTIWCIMSYLKFPSYKKIFGLIVLSSLAVLANLTLIPTATLLYLLTVFILIVYHRKKKFFWWKLLIIVIGCMVLLVAIDYTFELKTTGSLYYGSLDGFISVTLSTLSENFIGSASFIVLIFLVSLFAGLTYYYISFLFKNKVLLFISSPQNIFFLLLTGNVIGIILMANLLGVNYPEDRTAIYLYPLFTGSFLFMTDQLMTKNKVWLTTALPFLVIPVLLLFNMNISHAGFYRKETVPKAFFEKILKEQEKTTHKLTVGGYQLRRLVWDYTNFKNGWKLGRFHSGNYPSVMEDYLIIHRIDQEPKWRYLYEEIDYNENVELHLLKRKQFLNRHQLEQKPASTFINYDQEFLEIYNSPAEKFMNKRLLIRADLHLSSKETPLRAWVVTSISDSLNNEIMRDDMVLDWMYTEWNDREVQVQFLFSGLPDNAHHIKVYLWNVKEQVFNLNKGRVVLYELQDE